MARVSPMLFRVALCLAWLGCEPDAPPVPPTPHAEAAPPSFDERRVALVADLRAFVDDLTAAGRYHCCVSTPCTWCAELTAGCSCGPGLTRGEPVCEECAVLWTKGQGSVPGVDPSAVRSFLEARRSDPGCRPTPSP